MTNVIRFPISQPISPPLAPLDALVAELTDVELELARARLAQETRQLDALWFSYCLKRVLFWGLALWLLSTVFAGAAEAGQWRTFYNANGGYEGSSSRPGNGRFTNYYDRNGRYVGTELRRARR